MIEREAASGETVRVLLADDHRLFREGVASLLERAEDIELVGEAATGEEAVRLADELLADVVLMDLRMPRLDGVGAIARIVADQPEVRVLVLTTYVEDHDIVRAI